MKRLVLISALLGLALSGYAQSALYPYASYDLQEHVNKLPEILRCESGMNLHVGYSNLTWYNGAPQAENIAGFFNHPETYTIHGFNYGSDYVFPIWGPIGLDLKWLGITAGFGKIGEEFGSFMSWDFGLMPVFNLRLNDKVQLRAFGGVRAYVSFLMDGSDSFPLTTLSDNKDSIGKGAWLNKAMGVEVILKKTGIRLTYEDALKGRLKDKWYGDSTELRNTYDPRYKVLSLSVVFWML